ncbi:hypothetical protein PYCC9005_002463 [Savitreella phatthalungensis]
MSTSVEETVADCDDAAALAEELRVGREDDAAPDDLIDASVDQEADDDDEGGARDVVVTRTFVEDMRLELERRDDETGDDEVAELDTMVDTGLLEVSEGEADEGFTENGKLDDDDDGLTELG